MTIDQGTSAQHRGALCRCPVCGTDAPHLIPAYRGKPGQSSCEDCYESALAADTTRHRPTIRPERKPRSYEPSPWRAERQLQEDEL